MYQDYFGLRALPFSIAPDPHYLYLGEQHRDALAHLLYGVGAGGGFVLLTGEVGTGKTTVCRCLLQQLPDKTEVAYIVNPRQSPLELLASVCDDLGIASDPAQASIKHYTDRLTAHLLEVHRRGYRTILLIDEAQNLAVEVLEQIRLLTNLETDDCKLLQLVLLGQPELNEMLARPELRQFAQRITARYHLKPLTAAETRAYVNHRLAVAGMFVELFPAWALRRLHAASGGIPRLINVLCDRVMLGMYAESASRVRRDHVERAIREVLHVARPRRVPRLLAWAGGAVALLLLAGVLGWLLREPPVATGASGTAVPMPSAPVPSVPQAADATVLQPLGEAAALGLLVAAQRPGASTAPTDCIALRTQGLYCHRVHEAAAAVLALGRPLLAPRAGGYVLLAAQTDGTLRVRDAAGERVLPATGAELAGTGAMMLWSLPREAAEAPADGRYGAAEIATLNNWLDRIEAAPARAVGVAIEWVAPPTGAPAAGGLAALLARAPLARIDDARTVDSALLRERLAAFRRRAALPAASGIEETVVVALEQAIAGRATGAGES